MEKLFENKALDVYYTPIYMKKNRPAIKLEVICKENDLENLKEIIFSETSTIGVRYFQADRTIMNREIKKKDTIYGEVKVKKSTYKNVVKYSPEYEDCKKIAIEKDIPIKQIYDEIIKSGARNK